MRGVFLRLGERKLGDLLAVAFLAVIKRHQKIATPDHLARMNPDREDSRALDATENDHPSLGLDPPCTPDIVGVRAGIRNRQSNRDQHNRVKSQRLHRVAPLDLGSRDGSRAGTPARAPTPCAAAI